MRTHNTKSRVEEIRRGASTAFQEENKHIARALQKLLRGKPMVARKACNASTLIQARTAGSACARTSARPTKRVLRLLTCMITLAPLQASRHKTSVWHALHNAPRNPRSSADEKEFIFKPQTSHLNPSKSGEEKKGDPERKKKTQERSSP